jgi:hypothetical protein
VTAAAKARSAAAQWLLAPLRKKRLSGLLLADNFDVSLHNDAEKVFQSIVSAPPLSAVFHPEAANRGRKIGLTPYLGRFCSLTPLF